MKLREYGMQQTQHRYNDKKGGRGKPTSHIKRQTRKEKKRRKKE